MERSSNANLRIADLRRSYTQAGLSEEDVAVDPIEQFGHWFQDALDRGALEPNAMTLATATKDGRPSARVVLLKGFDERGFVFYTNYGSRKSGELTENPWAALVFHWTELARQVRITGTVSRVSTEESDAYFQSRPLGSRLGAWASQQSQIVAGRHILEQRLSELEAEYADGQVPLPEFWGGFRVQPDSMEFWQGRPNRLHDRLRYSLQPDGSWLIERLSP